MSRRPIQVCPLRGRSHGVSGCNTRNVEKQGKFGARFLLPAREGNRRGVYTNCLLHLKAAPAFI